MFVEKLPKNFHPANVSWQVRYRDENCKWKLKHFHKKSEAIFFAEKYDSEDPILAASICWLDKGVNNSNIREFNGQITWHRYEG